MDARSRTALQPIYQMLRPGYLGEQYDDFINYRGPNGKWCRVLRFVGKGRMVVLFRYETNPILRSGPPRDQEVLFLHEDGTFRPFDTNLIVARYRAEKGLKPYATYSWEKVVGAWLEANGARQYTGTNWVGRISGDLVGILRTWEQEHAGMAFPEEF